MPTTLDTTQVTDFAPRSVDQEPVEGRYAQLQSVLSARLGAAYGALLAEPRRSGTAITWLARVDGPVLTLDQIDVARRAAMLARVRRMAADVGALADRMEAEDRTARRLARMLKSVFQAPEPAHVRLVGDQPVCILWTHDAPAVASDRAAGSAAILPTMDGAAGVRGAVAGATTRDPATRDEATAAAAASHGVARKADGWVAGEAVAVRRGLGALHLAWLVPLLLVPVLAFAGLRTGALHPGPDAEIAVLRDQLRTLSAIDPTQCPSTPR